MLFCVKCQNERNANIETRIPSSYERCNRFKFACGFLLPRNLVSETLKEEHKPRVFENRVLRKIFGP
jgi:hypothetical protein